MNKKTSVLLLGVVLLISFAIPPLYSLVMHVQAKAHIAAGCEAFMADGGGKNPTQVGIFQNEFSKAALKDPVYLPIAKASDSLDADIEIALTNGFVSQWRDALSTVQGLCWSVGELGSSK